MTRLALVLAIGLTLGALIHLVTIMAIPRLAVDDAWSRIMAQAAPDGVTPIPAAEPGREALPLLDPSAAYAACRFDLSRGPVLISAPMPPNFWSVSLFGSDRAVFYAVTQEAASEDYFDIELRNEIQMRRFRMSETAPDPQTLHIEAPTNTGFALFRALTTGRSERATVEAELAAIHCGSLPEAADPERPPAIPLPPPRPQ